MNKNNICLYCNCFLIIVTLLFESCGSEEKNENAINYTKQQPINSVSDNTECIEKKKHANLDIAQNTRKYYIFGIVTADNKLVKLLKENHSIRLITLSCSVSSEYVCYNNIIDSEFVSINNKHISDLFK